MSRLTTLIKAHNDHAYVNSPLGEFVPGFCGFSFTAKNGEEYFNTRRMVKSWCTDTPCANCLGSIAEDGEFDQLVQSVTE